MIALASTAVTTADEFAQHIRLRAGDYFPDLDPGRVEVRLNWQSLRVNSRLFEFQVADRRAEHDLIAKVPYVVKGARRADGDDDPREDGPRLLFPKADPLVKGWHEFQALSTIHDCFSQLADPRFGTIRVFDAIGEPCSLIMEKGRDPSFNRTLRKASWFRRRASADFRAGFANAGAWLRRFHELPPFPHTATCITRRSDFAEAIEDFAGFLADHGTDERFFRRVGHEIVRAADVVLPDHLPLGLAHCDFAPRNILLGSQGRVTVFDTQGRWRTCVYLDVAHFLMALKASPSQVLSLGWRRDRRMIEDYENEFLHGYFGDGPVPLAAIRLFESLLILEWRGALADRYHKAKGLRRLAKHCRFFLWGRHLSRYLRRVMRDCTTKHEALT